MREIQLLFKQASLFIPVTATLDTTDEDDAGFILSIEMNESIVGHHFPAYSVWRYNEQGNPELEFISEQYTEALDFWLEG